MGNDYSFHKKFIEGEYISGFWNIAGYAVTALNSFIIIYFLSLREFGLYQLILSVMAFAESLTAGFLSDLVLTDFSKYIGRGEKGLAKKLFFEYALFKGVLVLVLMAILFFGAGLVSDHYGKDIALFLRVATIALIFRVGLSVQGLFFDGNIYFKAQSVSFLGELAKTFFIIGSVIFYKLGILEIILAYVVGHLFSFIFSSAYFYSLFKKTLAGYRSSQTGSLIRSLLAQYGPWMALRYLLSRIANNIRPWIIGIFLGVEAVGIFSFARNIIAVIARLMPLGTFGLLLPRELGNKQRLRYLFTRMTKYSLFLGLIYAVVSFLVFPLGVKLLFPKYQAAIPIFGIMSIILVLYSFYKMFRMVLVVFKEQKALLLRSIDESLLAPALLFILLPIFGVLGTAIEWVLTYTLTTILFYRYLVKAHPYLSLRAKDLFSFDKHDKEFLIKIFSYSLRFIKLKKI